MTIMKEWWWGFFVFKLTCECKFSNISLEADISMNILPVMTMVGTLIFLWTHFQLWLWWGLRRLLRKRFPESFWSAQGSRCCRPCWWGFNLCWQCWQWMVMVITGFNFWDQVGLDGGVGGLGDILSSIFGWVQLDISVIDLHGFDHHVGDHVHHHHNNHHQANPRPCSSVWGGGGHRGCWLWSDVYLHQGAPWRTLEGGFPSCLTGRKDIPDL